MESKPNVFTNLSCRNSDSSWHPVSPSVTFSHSSTSSAEDKLLHCTRQERTRPHSMSPQSRYLPRPAPALFRELYRLETKPGKLYVCYIIVSWSGNRKILIGKQCTAMASSSVPNRRACIASIVLGTLNPRPDGGAQRAQRAPPVVFRR